MNKSGFLLALFGLVGFLALGCAPDSKKDAPNDTAGKGSSAKNSGKEFHAHVHGPMGGEVFDIAGMKLECVAKYGQDLVVLAFYESDIKTPKKIKCTMLNGKIAAKAGETFEIEAVDLEDGMAHKFEIENADFAIARKSTGFKLEFELDGKTHKLDIPKDPHG